jgi:hypothetical protein
MKRMFIALLLGACFFTACNSMKKSAAEEAIKSVDAVFAPIAAEAQKYVPDQAKAIQDSLQQAKTSLANGDYSAALESAKGLPDKVNGLAGAIRAKKVELTSELNDLESTMPGLVSAVQNKVDTLKRTHKLPAGADDALTELKQKWGDASTSFKSGDYSSAMEQANAAKAKLADLQKMLGMKSGS